VIKPKTKELAIKATRTTTGPETSEITAESNKQTAVTIPNEFFFFIFNYY
jgi:hypothetical protein